MLHLQWFYLRLLKKGNYLKTKINPYDIREKIVLNDEEVIGSGSDIIVRQTAFDDEIPSWLMPKKLNKKTIKVYLQ